MDVHRRIKTSDRRVSDPRRSASPHPARRSNGHGHQPTRTRRGLIDAVVLVVVDPAASPAMTRRSAPRRQQCRSLRWGRPTDVRGGGCAGGRHPDHLTSQGRLIGRGGADPTGIGSGCDEPLGAGTGMTRLSCWSPALRGDRPGLTPAGDFALSVGVPSGLHPSTSRKIMLRVGRRLAPGGQSRDLGRGRDGGGLLPSRLLRARPQRHARACPNRPVMLRYPADG
jgi:hypothetical protein